VTVGLRTPQENVALDPTGTVAYVAESDPGTLAAIDLSNAGSAGWFPGSSSRSAW